MTRPSRPRTGLAALALVLLASPLAAQAPAAPAEAWRARLRAVADSALVHTAWGAEHSRRNYALALALAQADGVTLDEPALYAASYLHDLGAFAPFPVDKVDHGDRAAQLADSLLPPLGFPREKLATVRDIVSHHMYYHALGGSVEARYFRDADILDFLGATGAARILSLTTRAGVAKTPATAIATLRRFQRDLPAQVSTPAAKADAPRRAAALAAFLDALEAEAVAAGARPDSAAAF